MSTAAAHLSRMTNGEYFFIYTADFASIAPGASAQANVRVDGASNFQVFDIAASLQLNGAFQTAIDGTPLTVNSAAAGASGTAASSNNMPFYAHTRILIQTQDRPWMNIPVRTDTFCSHFTCRDWLAKQPLVAGNDVIQVTLYNDSPATIKGQIAFIGAKTVH
jgi:hypothetical protein